MRIRDLVGICLFLIGVGVILAIATGLRDNTPQDDKNLEDMSIREKKNECEELCTGGDNTPYIKTSCKSYCNQLYYFGGEESLDKEIKEGREQS